MAVDIVNFLIYNFQFFLVSFARAVAFLTVLPLFGGINVPNRIRVVLAFFLSYMTFPILTQLGYEIPTSLGDFFFILVGEVIIGLLMGFFVYLIFIAFQLAAQIFSTTFGLGFVEVVDPLSETSIPTYGTLLLIFATLVFISIDGPFLSFQAFLESYKKIWPYNLNLDSVKVISQFVVSGFNAMFAIAIKISLPIIAVILAIDITVGILAKTAPQMNVLNLSFDAKIVVGLILVIVFAMPMITLMQDMLKESFYKLWSFLKMFKV
ncbi:MAG: flagellar biosynthetic protein FliR [Spirochaetia bacterium]|nr:flagellar biosynthetic protein FliR [Spirochaetota bacterium]MCX8095986.1 flagellar biosynthetic protein FliR [Spirochaetota bacterium]MDW8113019.1 flagellar biosynthetic protein FliR [Spirochaetia bacterium]